MENIDDEGPNAMFGVDTVQLKQAATHRVFFAWVEELEEEAIYKAFCVA